MDVIYIFSHADNSIQESTFWNEAPRERHKPARQCLCNVLCPCGTTDHSAAVLRRLDASYDCKLYNFCVLIFASDTHDSSVAQLVQTDSSTTGRWIALEFYLITYAPLTELIEVTLVIPLI